MSRILALFLLAAALPAAAAPLPKDGKKDAVATVLEKLAGTWKIERQLQGEEEKKFKGERYLRFKGGTIRYWEAGDEDKADTFNFTIDPTKAPAEMEITAPHGSRLAIYELKGDTLTIASPYESGQPRPTKFKSTPENRVEIITLKRVKE